MGLFISRNRDFASTWSICLRKRSVLPDRPLTSLVTIIEPDRTIIGNYRVVAAWQVTRESAPTKTHPSADLRRDDPRVRAR